MAYLLFLFRGQWSVSDSSLYLDYSPAFFRLVGPAVFRGRQPLAQYHCSHFLLPACHVCRRQSWEYDSHIDSNKKWLWNKWHKFYFGFKKIKNTNHTNWTRQAKTWTRTISEIKMFNLHIYNFMTRYPLCYSLSRIVATNASPTTCHSLIPHRSLSVTGSRVGVVILGSIVFTFGAGRNTSSFSAKADRTWQKNSNSIATVEICLSEWTPTSISIYFCKFSVKFVRKFKHWTPLANTSACKSRIALKQVMFCITFVEM